MNSRASSAKREQKGMSHWISTAVARIVSASLLAIGNGATGSTQSNSFGDRWHQFSQPYFPAVREQSYYPSGYVQLRQAASAYFDWQTATHRESSGYSGPSSVVGFDDHYCGLDDLDLDPLDSIEGIALQIEAVENDLLDAGYPRSFFEIDLLSYEARLLVDKGYVSPTANIPLDDGLRGVENLISRLETRRKNMLPHLPEIVDAFCGGAGELAVYISTRPLGGRVWVINRFRFLVCRAQRLNPWDYDRCHFWTEVTPEQPFMMSGNYVYQAVWPDGHRVRGARQIELDEISLRRQELISR